MTLLIFVLAAAGAVLGGAYVLKRRREGAHILAAFGPDVHPSTVAAIARLNGKERAELERDGLWIKDHERELAQRFRGQWIAVVRGEVAAIGSTADEAWRAAASSRAGRAAFVRRIA